MLVGMLEFFAMGCVHFHLLITQYNLYSLKYQIAGQ